MPRTKLPQDLEDEILARVPPLSLARFRTVCQRWNTLVDDKRFIKHHLDCVSPQFILRTHDSKIYSIGINLDDSLQVRELNLETQGTKKLRLYRNMYHFDGFLLCPALPDELAIWNPWLKQQTKWIEPKRQRFNFYGLGYDNSRSDKGYKILGLNYRFEYECVPRDEVLARRTIIYPSVSIYEFATNAWKDLNLGPINWSFLSRGTVLSLNGTLYWIAARDDGGRGETFVRNTFVQSFDFSTERFKPFCLLPPNNGTELLGVFRGDRLSVLEQVTTTGNINVWVTKNKISGDSNELVSWRLLMTVSIPNFPILENLLRSKSRPSYFMDNNNDKRLIICTCDEESGKPCIYIVKEDRFKKVEIGFEVESWPFHVVYVPSLVPIPSSQDLQS